MRRRRRRQKANGDQIQQDKIIHDILYTLGATSLEQQEVVLEVAGGIVSRRAPLKSQSAPDESSSRGNAAGKYLSLMDCFLVNTTHARTSDGTDERKHVVVDG